jgi:exonuclease SbcC
VKPLLLELQAFGPFLARTVVDFNPLHDAGTRFFLIHGTTGAGKTTILDAMCYALYGECTGTSRDESMVRCQYAPPTISTLARFEFQIRETRYRVERRPEYQGIGRRAGIVTIPREASLARWSAGGWSLIADKPKDVTEYLLNTLGFDHQQFRQVIVLPQGEFRQLLMTDTKSRGDILRRLFGVGIYRLIEEGLKRRHKDLEKEIRELEVVLLALRNGAELLSGEQPATRIAAMEEEVAQSEPELARRRDALSQAELAYSQAGEVAQRFREAASAADVLRGLRLQGAEMEALGARLVRVERCQTAEPAFVAWQQSVARAEQQRTRLGVQQRAHKEVIQRHTQATLAHEKARGRDGELSALRSRAATLEALLPRLAQLEQAVNVAAAEERASEQLSVRRSKLVKDAEQAAVLSRTYRQKGEALAPLAERHPELRAEALRLRQALTDRGELERTQDEASGAEALVEKERGALRKMNAALAAAQESAEEARLARERGKAAVLAEVLEDDKPCPVCGSIHHPAPAVALVAPPTEQEVEALLGQVVEAEKRRSLASDRVATAEKKAAVLRARAEEQRGRLGDAANAPVSELQRQAEEAEQRSSAAGKAAAERNDLAKKESNARESEQRLAHELAQVADQCEMQKIKAGRAAGERDSLRSAIPPELEDGGRVRDQHDELRTQIRLIEEGLAEALQQLELAREEHARSEALLVELMAQEGEATTAEGTTLAARDARFAELELTLSDFNLLRTEVPRLATARQTLARWREDLGRAEQRAQDAEARLAGITNPDLTELKRTADVARTSHDDLARRLTILRERIEKDRALAERLQQQEALVVARRGQFEVIAELSLLASGAPFQGGRLPSLSEYVMKALLDEVTVAATRRLEILTGGRYRLLRREDGKSRKTSTVLDIVVHDAYSGETRLPGSLSGGETFLASLALALGLSEVVQAYAGGMDIGCLFIDEGFGMLDQRALDEAIEVLLQLQQGNRLVGIISHVTELRESIPIQLIVEADEPGKGSTIRFKG